MYTPDTSHSFLLLLSLSYAIAQSGAAQVPAACDRPLLLRTHHPRHGPPHGNAVNAQLTDMPLRYLVAPPSLTWSVALTHFSCTAPVPQEADAAILYRCLRAIISSCDVFGGSLFALASSVVRRHTACLCCSPHKSSHGSAALLGRDPARLKAPPCSPARSSSCLSIFLPTRLPDGRPHPPRPPVLPLPGGGGPARGLHQRSQGAGQRQQGHKSRTPSFKQRRFKKDVSTTCDTIYLIWSACHLRRPCSSC